MEQEMKSGTIRMPRRCFSTTSTRIHFLYNYICMKRSHKRDLERDLDKLQQGVSLNEVHVAKLQPPPRQHSVSARIKHVRMRIWYSPRMRSIRPFEHAPLHTGEDFGISRTKISRGFRGFPDFTRDFKISSEISGEAYNYTRFLQVADPSE